MRALSSPKPSTLDSRGWIHGHFGDQRWGRAGLGRPGREGTNMVDVTFSTPLARKEKLSRVPLWRVRGPLQAKPTHLEDVAVGQVCPPVVGMADLGSSRKGGKFMCSSSHCMLSVPRSLERCLRCAPCMSRVLSPPCARGSQMDAVRVQEDWDRKNRPRMQRCILGGAGSHPPWNMRCWVVIILVFFCMRLRPGDGSGAYRGPPCSLSGRGLAALLFPLSTT